MMQFSFIKGAGTMKRSDKEKKLEKKINDLEKIIHHLSCKINDLIEQQNDFHQCSVETRTLLEEMLHTFDESMLCSKSSESYEINNLVDVELSSKKYEIN